MPVYRQAYSRTSAANSLASVITTLSSASEEALLALTISVSCFLLNTSRERPLSNMAGGTADEFKELPIAVCFRRNCCTSSDTL